MGSVHLSNLAIYRILGAILLLAGLKLCFYLKGLEGNPTGLLDTFGPRQIACKKCARHFAN